MKRTLIFFMLFCSIPFAALAQQGERQQYISDEITVTIRDKPRNDATSIGTVKTGTKVTVLEVLGADSFARIRTTDGREGWITARFLSAEPAAKDRLAPIRQQLDEANRSVKTLQGELAQAQDRLTKLRPAMELGHDNDRLRDQIAQSEQANLEMKQRYDEEKARRKTLITGAALVGTGIIAGLVLPLLGRGRKRRYGDF